MWMVNIAHCPHRRCVVFDSPHPFLLLFVSFSLRQGVAKKFYYWARGVTFFWLYNEKKGMSKVRACVRACVHQRWCVLSS